MTSSERSLRNSVELFAAVALGVVLPRSAAGQDWRTILGPERARLIESVGRVAFPDHSIRWDGRVRIVSGSEVSKAVLFPGLAAIPYAAGQIVVSGVELPDDAKEAVRRVKSFENLPAGYAVTRLVVLRIDEKGNVLEHRSGVLDANSVATECRAVALNGTQPGTTWPLLRVRYRSWHSSGNWVGAVDWNTSVESDGMTIVERIPAGFWRRNKDGHEASDVLVLKRLPEDEIEILGASTGRALRYRCGRLCSVPASVVLESF